jgi:hypothetical protein
MSLSNVDLYYDTLFITKKKQKKNIFFIKTSNVLLKQQSAGRHVTQANYPDSDKNKSLILLVNATCLAEKQQIQIS